MSEQALSASTPSPFEQRHAIWADLHARYGPARSHPFAWRLHDLARDEGPLARLRAALALARTLYAMGRFGEVLAALPEPDYGPSADPALRAHNLGLRARCLWLQEKPDAAGVVAEAAFAGNPDRLSGLHAHAYFLFLTDNPHAALSLCLDYQDAAHAAGAKVDESWAGLVADWARSRLTGVSSPLQAHAALARLGAIAPAEAAHGAAVHAEAAFHQGPAGSLVWLDHALDQGERFGQHHLKARLLHLKSRALDAGGLLGDASRILKLARETAQRQGAWRYLRDMAG